MLQSENTEIDAEKLSARLEVLVMLHKIDIPFFLFQNISDLCYFSITISTASIVSTAQEINILNY